MCGIAGIFNLNGERQISKDTLGKMAAVLRHRGPDGYGFYRDNRIGLAHARLSIIDLEGSWQPIHNEAKTVWMIINGEIFNYIELREFLERRGHLFYTRSDSEVAVHLYEELGKDFLQHINGQFALAIWDRNKDLLFLARDRVGIRPLFYTVVDGTLLFASEIKALFMDNRVGRDIDPVSLNQIFTFWMPISPRTAFRDVFEVPAGHFMTVRKGKRQVRKYWDLDFLRPDRIKDEEEYANELRRLLIDAARLRLRADVPVGAYLSGGLDSSVTTALIAGYSDAPLRTFSLTFEDRAFDERDYQKELIAHLGTDHSSMHCTCEDIGRIFPQVIWHTETPILRTAPAPLCLLSRLVRESGYKVVLTGEGSDEVLAGYDIFKEVKIRRFIEKFPGSKYRPQIFRRLYPYLKNSPIKSLSYAEAFFGMDSSGYPPVFYSHVPRWETTKKTHRFFSRELLQSCCGNRNTEELLELMPAGINLYDDLSKAQYIEIKTLLSSYLLSSQGDRVGMAHSVEGRFPFLDHRVIEFSCKLPPHLRMKALREKHLLKKSAGSLLPTSITRRTKQPYMAPDARSFFNNNGSAVYLEDLLSEKNLRRTGYFDPKAVAMLVKKCRRSPVLGFKDNMAAVGIISTLLLHDQFIDNFDSKTKDMKAEKKEARVAVGI